MQIDKNTRLNLVIGFPLEHTQSPFLHNELYNLFQINSVLLAFSNKNLKSIIQTIRTLSVDLTAVTMPFKEKVMRYLNDYDEDVAVIKAVNTIVQKDGKLIGYNTDLDGINFACREINFNHKNVLLIGAGGAARIAAFYLMKKHANIFYLNRTKQRAMKLIKEFGGEIVSNLHLKDLSIDIIINATPLGMLPNTEVSPLPGYQFKPQQIVFDMVYNPLMTKLLTEAKRADAKIIQGLDMFIGQGFRQIELFKNIKISDEIFFEIKNKLMIGR